MSRAIEDERATGPVRPWAGRTACMNQGGLAHSPRSGRPVRALDGVIMRLPAIFFGIVGVLSLLVTLWPEPPARPITGLHVRGATAALDRPSLAEIKDRDASVHATIKDDPQFRLMRSWSSAGIAPLDIEIGPIPAVNYLGVTYQGSVKDREGRNALYLRCDSNGRQRPLSTGGTHTALLEVVTPLANWCPKGEVWLHMIGGSAGENIGVALPYEVSQIAYWKRGYIGYTAFFVLAFLIVLSIFHVGGLAARASRSGLDPVLAGLLAVGGSALIGFYAYAWAPVPAPLGLVPIALVMTAAVAVRLLAPELARSVWRAQRGPVTAWALVAAWAFTVLHLGSTGSGTWEVNYRYAPAAWSSDHTLPLYLAEAARIGSVASEGILGSWSLSDRPPLMAGGYLLLGDVYSLLQVGNDGPYLQPIVLGVGGVVFCALWAATFYWAARRIGRLSPRLAGLGVFLVAATPFALFNTAYTWPKLLAAAFSLAAAAYAFRPRPGRLRVAEALTFGALAGLALLSHASSAFFLAPVSLLYFVQRLWRSPVAATAGATLGLSMLAVWSAFKAAVLPSSDPLIKFALTGDLGFGHPAASLVDLVRARYADLSLSDWFHTKLEIAAYLFTPYPRPGPLALARPLAPPAYSEGDVLGQLRAWDFFSFTAGNVAILVLAVAAIAAAAFGWGARRGSPGVARSLSLAAVGCYGLFVTTTFLPLIIHQFSYDAILALCLGGIVTLSAWRAGRTSLAWLAGLTSAYTALVWVAAPVRSLVTFDYVAAVGLLVLAVSVALSWKASGQLRSARPSAQSAAAVSGPRS